MNLMIRRLGCPWRVLEDVTGVVKLEMADPFGKDELREFTDDVSGRVLEHRWAGTARKLEMKVFRRMRGHDKVRQGAVASDGFRVISTCGHQSFPNQRATCGYVRQSRLLCVLAVSHHAHDAHALVCCGLFVFPSFLSLCTTCQLQRAPHEAAIRCRRSDDGPVCHVGPCESRQRAVTREVVARLRRLLVPSRRCFASASP